MITLLTRLVYFIYIIKRYRLYKLFKKNESTSFIYYIFVCLFFIPTVREENVGIRLRIALEKLGPIFVKLGQMISIQEELATPEIAEELSLLQYRVNPFDYKLSKKIIEDSLNIKLEDVFLDFEEHPIASASMAQVHSAYIELKNSQGIYKQKVAIKIIRPGITKYIKIDLKLMRLCEKFLDIISNKHERLRLSEVINELENILLNELNLKNELNNALRLERNWKNSDKLYIPKVFPQISSSNVLVIEFVDAVPIFDMDTLINNKVNLKYLSAIGVEIFFTQLLRDNFFHADMHPGNIFVDITNPEKPKYIAIDFGVIGILNKQDKKYIAENLLAFFDRDYEKVAELHVNSGWVRGNVEICEFEKAIYDACDSMFRKPLNEISFANVLIKLFDVAKNFNMIVQPQLILLQRTLVYIEGMGKKLYPELNLWETAHPYLKLWVKEQYNFKPSIEIVKRAPFIMESVAYLPDTIYRLFDDNAQISKKIDLLHKDYIKLENIIYRIFFAIFFVFFLMLGILGILLKLYILSIVVFILSFVLMIIIMILYIIQGKNND